MGPSKNVYAEMSIRAMPEGGYVVFAGTRPDYGVADPRYATNDVDDALKYLRGAILKPEESPGGNLADANQTNPHDS